MTKATEEILEERANTHGSFKNNAIVMQGLKAVMRLHGAKWDALPLMHREALEMIVHKIGRILSGDYNFSDHWEDIAGYATLIVKEIKRKEDKQNV